MTESQVCVYILGAEGSPLVKIGWTNNPSRRLADLQSGSPLALRLLATCEGDARLESALHGHFADRRVRGEWFDLGDDPVDLVEPIAKQEQARITEQTGRKPKHTLWAPGPLTSEIIAWFPDDPPSAYERVKQECPTWEKAGRCLCDS
ncbi:GIY-YIG nuclease family protein [Streptomyces sp. NBC_01547]|uniref:GIY-YIG nuclease family protein n=1 Tax=Streptomyces sp. NBC_01547 TaxID=2975873 RepID=UPI002F90BE79